jgi:hypothetical protein
VFISLSHRRINRETLLANASLMFLPDRVDVHSGVLNTARECSIYN